MSKKSKKTEEAYAEFTEQSEPAPKLVLAESDQPKTVPPKPVTVKPAQPVKKQVLRFPGKPAKPIFDRAVCIITKRIGDMPVVVKSLVVPTMKGFFRLGEHTFFVDISKAIFVSKKGPYLRYDLEVTEPLDNAPVTDTITHAPIQLGDNVHYSKNVDLVVHGKVIQQALAAVGEGTKFNLMWIIMLVIGAVMGFAFGAIFGPAIMPK